MGLFNRLMNRKPKTIKTIDTENVTGRMIQAGLDAMTDPFVCDRSDLLLAAIFREMSRYAPEVQIETGK